MTYGDAAAALTAVVSPAIDVATRVVGADVAVVVVATFGILAYCLHKGWLVFGREHSALAEDRDWWRNTAIRALDLGEQAFASRSPD